MISSTADYKTANFASVRQVKAKVELYNGSALATTYTDTDKIISIEIQRVGEDGKFFGFGICQRLNLHLVDKERALSISTANTLKVSLGVKLADGTVEYKGFPTFEVSEVHRDEKTNELSITAYDALYRASSHTVEELGMEAPYTVKDFCEASSALLGVSVSGVGNFLLSYPNGANFEGTEAIRTALDMVAEATQTIYYMNSENLLCFKALDRDGKAVFTIDKAKYIELKTSGARRLQTICNTTELGDSVSEGTTIIGSTQYVRDNAFWELREDIATLVHNAVEAIGNISIEMLECKWRGDVSLEVGDKLQFITKDNKAVNTYLLNDTISYDGALSEKTIWKYSDNESETASNPTSIGDALKQTYARVDKQNREITLLASEVKTQKEAIKKTVKQVDVEYYLSTSSSIPTGGTWNTEAPTWEENKYMWSRQKITYTDGTYVVRNATCIAGAKGEDGKDGTNGKPGRGVTSITTEYYISASDTELTGGAWSNTQPTWEEGKYIWTRSKIVYNNPASTEYTTAVCDATWKEINAIQGEQKTIITNVAELKVAKDNIVASVSEIAETQNDLSSTVADIQNGVAEQNKSNAQQFETLTKKVDASMTSEQVKIAISTELAKGTDKVSTSTGFTFDDEGLTISKSDSEIGTNINEDGMKITKSGKEVLTADNTGVKARNLHATTYLIIGTNSRFEDYGSNRTGCFWIGG